MVEGKKERKKKLDSATRGRRMYAWRKVMAQNDKINGSTTTNMDIDVSFDHAGVFVCVADCARQILAPLTKPAFCYRRWKGVLFIVFIGFHLYMRRFRSRVGVIDTESGEKKKKRERDRKIIYNAGIRMRAFRRMNVSYILIVNMIRATRADRFIFRIINVFRDATSLLHSRDT